jgi:hypothetical protein
MSNVVKFPFNVADRGGMASVYRRHRVKCEARAREIGTVELTESAKNSRLRDARKTAWHEAETRVEYFHRRMEFECVVGRMQEMGLPEGNSHPAPRDRMEAVRLWREALVYQFLLPAPRNDCVAWKKARLAIGEIEKAGMTRDRAQNVIDGDIAFLAAHPTKKSKPMSAEAKERRRNFKEAMRQRIRDIAASRDLSDEEIKPVLRLKHYQLVNFTEKHGVNLEWLLEGRGRIFEKDPIILSPNSTGAELAAVVRTLPEAKQRTIEAVVDQLLKERGAMKRPLVTLD